MPDVHRCVFGPLEALENVQINGVRVIGPLHGCQQILHSGSIELAGNFQPAQSYKPTQLFDTRRGRLRMNSPHERHAEPVQNRCHRFIGFDTLLSLHKSDTKVC